MKHRLNPWVSKIPWRRNWQPTPVFLPGESHGQRSRADCSPWVAQSQTWLKWLSTHASLHTLLHLSEISFLSESPLSKFRLKLVVFVLKNHPSQHSVSLLSPRPEESGVLMPSGILLQCLHHKSLLDSHREVVFSHHIASPVCGVMHDPQKGNRMRYGLIFYN